MSKYSKPGRSGPAVAGNQTSGSISSGYCGTKLTSPSIAGNNGSKQWAPTTAVPIPQRKQMGGIG